MGGQAAKGLEGFIGGQVPFRRQFASKQQQQLAQLQGEAAAEQGWLEPGQAIEGQQQLLLQHPFAPVHAAEALDHGGDRLAALGLADQGLVGVIAAHDHLLLAHQQVGEGILELGMDQADRAGATAHHGPVPLGEAPAVDLLHQHLQRDAVAHGRTLQQGLGSQVPHQLLQHFRLFAQGGAAPEPFGQIGDRDLLELLLLQGGEGLLAGAGPQ